MPLTSLHLRKAAVIAMLTLTRVAAYASTVASQDFGSSPIATPVNVNVVVPAVSPGPASLSLRYSIDFSLGGCTPNATGCTAVVTFNPTHPGLRQDALIVKDGNGGVAEEIFLHGTGVGAAPVFVPALATLQFCGGEVCPPPNFQGIAAEASGRILLLNGTKNSICEFDPKTGNCTNIAGLPATSSTLPAIGALAVDAGGNIYYSYDDESTNAIHRIDAVTGTDAIFLPTVGANSLLIAPTGAMYYVQGDQIFAADPNSKAVTLIAGNGSHGYGGDGGPAVSAELAYPAGMAFDNLGNLYVADFGNQRVRKIDHTGTITTLAGTGAIANSGDGGLAINAALSFPNSLAIDAAGDLYVSTIGITVIRRIDAGTGLISTIAGAGGSGDRFVGPGSTASAQMTPGGVLAIDPSGNLWSLSGALFEISTSAYPVHFPFATFGQTSSQTVSLLNAGNANLDQPAIDLSGANPTAFGVSSSCAPEIAAGTTCAITVSFTAGLYAAPEANLTLADKASPSPQTIPVAGASGSLPPATEQLPGVEVGASSATPQVVNVQLPGNVSGLTAALAYGAEFSLGALSCSGTGTISCSIPVTFTPLYPGLRRDAIQFRDSTGTVVYEYFLGATGRGPQWLSDPEQVGSMTMPADTMLSAIDGAGNLYAVSNQPTTKSGTVYKFDKSSGQWTTFAGQSNSGYDTGDGGPATKATFAYVNSALVDAAGNVLVGETFAIRRIDAHTGIVTTLAQQGGEVFAMDTHGYVYFAESSGGAVNKLDPSTGVITTYAGNGQIGLATGDGGPATAATLGWIYGLGVDDGGNLFISTYPNLRRVDAKTGIITTYAQSCESSSISFDPAGDLLLACGEIEIVPPGGGTPRFIETSLDNVFGPMLRDPSGTFYNSDGRIFGPGLQTIFYMPSAIVGASSQGTIQLTNSGNESLLINAIALTGANANWFSQDTTCGQTLSPAQSCALNLTFTPIQSGPATAALNITSTLPPLQTTLNSTGSAGTLQLSQNSLDFGVQPSSTSTTLPVTLFNFGSIPVTISGMSINGPNASDFTVASNCGSHLSAGGVCELYVTFTAGAVGARTASLSISDNATGSPQTISLTAMVSGAAPSVGYVAYWGVNNTGVTVSWSTDVPATTQLAYGTTTALGQFSPLQTTLANSHGVVLTNLNPGTTYYFVAQSKAANGTTGYSTTYSFTTSGTATTAAAPVISAVTVMNVSATSATITWTTDQATSSQVNYGTSTSYGSSSTLDPTLVTSHSVTLSGLTAGVTYDFAAVSANSASVSSTSPNSTFTTTALSTGGPAPSVGYVAYWGVNNTGVTVSWSTDVPATTQLAYGTTTALGQFSPLQTTLANSHGVVLTNLNPGTTYYFVAQSKAANGTTGYSTTYSFTTSGTATTAAAPVISAITVMNVSATSATITWTTDQATSSQVNYGTSTSYGSSSTLDPTLVTSHSVTLSGLTAGVSYDFSVVSANSASVSSTSPNSTFTTTALSTGGPAPSVGYVAYWGVNNTGVTVSWSTDVPATTQLAYGTTTALGQFSPLQTTLANSHGVVLTNLNPGTTYYFVAQSKAANGTTGYSTTYSFTTSGTATTAAAPVISAITVMNVSATSATITWTTDQATSSQVNYGTSTSYGSSSTLDPTLVTSHSVTLSGLTAGVTYDFAAVSADSANVFATSPNSTFTTTALSTGGPAPSVGYVAYWGVNNTGVTVSWSTDVPATTQLAYGTTTALGQFSPLQTTLANSHGVVLTNLNPGTTYYFVAQSKAANGTTGYSTTYSFTTSGTATTAAAPVISAITVMNVSATSATITWTTDQATSSQVNYGTSTSYGFSSTLDPTLVTSHSVTLSGLTAGVSYDFSVVSADSANVSSTSPNSTFTTAASIGGTAPYVGYIAFWGVNKTGVTISWSTDVPATTQLAYGTTTALGQLSPLQTAFANNHGVVLTNLNPGTTYYFVAQSTGADGATGYSTTYTFTTSAGN